MSVNPRNVTGATLGAVAHLALLGPSWPFRGGIARTTTALAAALAARGDLAAFAVPARQYPAWLYPGGADRDDGACPRLPAADPCFAVLEPWTWGRLLRRLRASRPEVLALPYWTWAWAPLLRAVQLARIAPAVAIVHNPADHGAGRAQRAAASAVLGRCAGYFCHAASVADAIRRRFPGRPVDVHPLPPDPAPAPPREAARARLGLAEGEIAVLCFGVIRPYKGVDVLLEAFAGIPDELPVRLLLAGEPWGEAGEAVRRLLAAPALAGRARAHLGWLPEEEVGWWLAAADAAVLPYRAATGSAVAAQLLGAGLPVVASRVGGLAEVVEEGVSGLLVPPGDAGALATALARLADRDLRVRLAAGARSCAARWTWDSYAAALTALAGVVSAGSHHP
jgi:glycosyltransferase involved in cell wall biosynthesis